MARRGTRWPASRFLSVEGSSMVLSIRPISLYPGRLREYAVQEDIHHAPLPVVHVEGDPQLRAVQYAHDVLDDEGGEDRADEGAPQQEGGDVPQLAPLAAQQRDPLEEAQ